VDAEARLAGVENDRRGLGEGDPVVVPLGVRDLDVGKAVVVTT
jgi:hypothetical protein